MLIEKTQSKLHHFKEFSKDSLKEFIETMQDFFWFSMRSFYTLPKAFQYKQETFKYLHMLSVQIFPILFISSVAFGGLIVIEVGHQLSMFGAKTLTGRTTALSVLRELGPILTGIVTIAQFGARSASELGSMKISEQIDALRAFGTDPIARLVAPRLAASLIMYPSLTAFADTIALITGGLIASFQLHIDSGIYWNSVIDLLVPGDWVIAFSKPPLFAITTTLICCYNGFAVTGGTAGVGSATIKGIVVALGTVLILNFYLTKLIVENIILP